MSKNSFKISISDGLVLNVERGMYGLEDSNGNAITTYPYSYISTLFHCNGKAILLFEDVDGMYGILNVSGEEIIDPIYDELKMDRDGNSIVGLRNNEWETLEIA